MNFKASRELARLLKWTFLLLNLVGLIAIVFLFIHYLPSDVLSENPATGGDRGSHFWPLVTLVERGLPDFIIRSWSPGNLGGEPHLLHYFPLPHLLMAFLSLFMLLGKAFNVGTLLPLATLPLSIFFGLKAMKLRDPLPLLGVLGSLVFLYNEGFSMWGGNTLPTLAGEFAHVYALNFLFLTVGAIAWELRNHKPPLLSAFLSAALALSHGYVFVALPSFYLSVILFGRHRSWRERFTHCFWSGIFTVFLALWFLLPMIQNARWTTPHSMTWISDNLLKESLPPIFYPVLLLLGVGLVGLFVGGRSRGRLKANLRLGVFWLIPAVFYFVMYFVFPSVGLVDVRAIPKMEIIGCVLALLLFGRVLRQWGGRVFVCLAVIPLLVSSVWWIDFHVSKFPYWLQWNYSGWENKALYEPLMDLSRDLRGTFSDPRVIYEHSDVNDGAGTLRVFEMLPYFARRATLESTYLQAGILSPLAFDLQARVSKTPSCPFYSEYPCPPYDVETSEEKLRLMSVGDLILVTEEVRKQADASPWLEKKKVYGPWHLYSLKEPPQLVEVATRPLLPLKTAGWRQEFYKWFQEYEGTQNFLVAGREAGAITLIDNLIGNPDILSSGGNCHPRLEVDINSVRLQTDCPGKLHILKLAYHPSWESSTGDPFYLVSPGFLALVPSGQGALWEVANLVSILTFMILALSAFLLRRGRSKSADLDPASFSVRKPPMHS